MDTIKNMLRIAGMTTAMTIIIKGFFLRGGNK